MVEAFGGNTICRRVIIRNQSVALRARKVRASSVSVYAGIFLLTIGFMALGYKGGGTSPEPGVVAATQASSSNQSAGTPERVSVDQLAAASAVTNLAEVTNLPTAGDLREATTTLYIKKQLAQTDAEVITKPQIVQPTTSQERGITTYVAKRGDDLSKIAKQFNVSTQTLRWANDTTSDAVQAGKKVTVPLTDGVVYTVKSGDTVASIARKYKVDSERIIFYNDLDIDAKLKKGTKIVLPNGNLPETERPGYEAPRPTYSGQQSQTTGVDYGYAKVSAGNRYAPGNCTWYAYERRSALGKPIGSLWGNAYSWASSARMAGFKVDQNPQPGAIFQTSSGGGGYGHVGIVERVDAKNIYVSDMNYGGYNVVTSRTIPRSSLGGYNFIH